MINNIVKDMSREHRQDFHIVRLNGFIHTDDKLALKEIWRQLGKEMQVDDDLLNRVSSNVMFSVNTQPLLTIHSPTMLTPWHPYWHCCPTLRKSWAWMRESRRNP